MGGANGYGMLKSTFDNDQIENQNQFDVSTDANVNNMVVEGPAEESTATDQDNSAAASFNDDNGMLNTSATDIADNNDDDNDSVTSTKSTYKDLCKQLTISLEKKNTRHREDRKEQKRLEQKVSELEKEIERQTIEKNMFVHKVSTLEREIEQQKLVVAGLLDVAIPKI
jgi:septal ring factor EnvC (AmiA/AmiB activator)